LCYTDCKTTTTYILLLYYIADYGKNIFIIKDYIPLIEFILYSISLGAFKLAKQLACSPSDWVWLVLTYKSNQSH